MRNLQVVANECMKELDNIGIQYGNIVEFKVNTRAKRRWGQCRKVPGGYSINISHYLLDETTDIKGLKSTICHELLHTCSGSRGHDKGWQRLAAKTNKAYGYNIKRTSSAEEKGCVCKPNDVSKKPKYKIICKNCGWEVLRYKSTKVSKNLSNYRCRDCKGYLSIVWM